MTGTRAEGAVTRGREDFSLETEIVRGDFLYMSGSEVHVVGEVGVGGGSGDETENSADGAGAAASASSVATSALRRTAAREDSAVASSYA